MACFLRITLMLQISFRFLSFVVFLLAFPQNSKSEQFSLRSYVESETFSESLPVYVLANDLDYKLDYGRKLYTHNEISFKFKYKRWIVSTFSRYDFWLDYTDDSMLLVWWRVR